MTPHCHADFSGTDGYFLLLTLFSGALLGSITHCIGMCGPFVLAQISAFDDKKSKNFTRNLLLPYHFGRLTTYIFLGVLATIIATPITAIPALQIISPILLIIAGVIFIASAFSIVLPRKILSLNFGLCGAPNWIIQKITLLLPQNSLLNGYLLGIILGFLPCGLVYAAIIAVAATSDILLAFLGMAAFALGTMPVLMIISASGKMLLNKKYSWLKPASAILMAFNGVMLFIMAGKWFV